MNNGDVMGVASLQKFGVLLGFGLVALLCLLVPPLLHNSPTADEGGFLQYGQQILRDHTARRFQPFHNSKMPVNALQALPGALLPDADWVPPSSATSVEFLGGRFVTVLFTLLLAFYLFRWAWELYGAPGAILSLGLFVFCPNILAHGNLITTDMPAACLMSVAVYYFARLRLNPTLNNFVKSAFVTGLAQLTKFTALHLLPVFILFTFLPPIWFPPPAPTTSSPAAPRHPARSPTFPRPQRSRACGTRYAHPAYRRKGGRGLRYHGKFRFFAVAGLCLIYALIVWLVINTGFLWEDLFRPRAEFYPAGDPATAGWLGKLPMPFSFGYFQGLVMTWRDDSPYPDWLYLLGQHSKERFAWYFPLAMLWKMPLGTLALLCLALLCKPSKKIPSQVLILGTVCYLFVYFALFHGHQIGIRFLLPVFPLLHLAIGRITLSRIWLEHKIFRIFCWGLLGWIAVSSLSYFPHFIPYFNETIGNRLNAYRYLGDSNLDWNQANWYKEQYLRKHPEIKPIYNPTPETRGIVLLRANDVIGIQDPERFLWLRERHRPIDHIAHAWLIYDLNYGDTSQDPNSSRKRSDPISSR